MAIEAYVLQECHTFFHFFEKSDPNAIPLVGKRSVLVNIECRAIQMRHGWIGVNKSHQTPAVTAFRDSVISVHNKYARLRQVSIVSDVLPILIGYVRLPSM
jgi:hypothetical protein